MRPMRSVWAANERAELHEARSGSDARTLGERLGDALRLHVLTVAELARRASDAAELARMLDAEPPGAPSLVARRRAAGRRA